MKRTLLSVLLLAVCMLFCCHGVFAEDNADMSLEKAMQQATAWVVDKENNSITFISPQETNDVNINVHEKFADVPWDAWYHRALSHLTQLGIVQGVSEDEFAPQGSVSRAEFAAMLALIEGVDLAAYRGVSSFDDVAATAWYGPQIEWAYRNGLINGFDNGLFYPEAPLTREQSAVIVERYAVMNESRVLELNRYELSESVKTTLSSGEIETIEALLDVPEYEDRSDISDWAEYSVTEMSISGIFCGDGEGGFHPQDNITRAECVKLLSAYILYDTAPAFYFPGGSHIEYLKPTEEELQADSRLSAGNAEGTEHGSSFSFEMTVDATDTGGVRTSWKRITHQRITDVALSLLKQDTGEGGRAYIFNRFGEAVGTGTNRTTGRELLKKMAWYTDKIENQNSKYYSHFYDPDTGTSYEGSTTINAYRYFNNHYYDAYTYYLNGNKYIGYKEIGMSIHYLEDLNTPYHAANITTENSKHAAYETWANDVAANHTTTMTYAAYRYVYDSTFIGMSNNFAGLAKGSLSVCNRFDHGNADVVAQARAATRTNLGRTERAVCGLLNRFYYNSQM